MTGRRSMAAAVLILCLAAADLAAQERFGIVRQQAIAEVSGLRVITVRDGASDTCYTLFMLEGSVAPAGVPAPPVSDEAAAQSLRRIRDAAAKRDRQLAELKERTETRAAPIFDPTRTSGLFEAERRKIDDEYDQVLRREMPSTYPWASATPGMRSGGFEEQATAMRRAIVDPDPIATLKALDERFSRLEALLQSAAAAPRLAVTGPVSCTPPVADPAKR